MKKMYLLLVYSFLAYGAANQVLNQHQGNQITPGTIYDLTKQASPMPNQVS